MSQYSIPIKERVETEIAVSIIEKIYIRYKQIFEHQSRKARENM